MTEPNRGDGSGERVTLRKCRVHGWISEAWVARTSPDLGDEFDYCALCHPKGARSITEDMEFSKPRTFIPEESPDTQPRAREKHLERLLKLWLVLIDSPAADTKEILRRDTREALASTEETDEPRCPECESDDPGMCFVGPHSYRPHRHGESGSSFHKCCPDPWHSTTHSEERND